MRLLRGAAAVVELTPTTLDAQLAELASQPARRATLGAAGRQAWSTGRGALDRTIAGDPGVKARRAVEDEWLKAQKKKAEGE